MMADSTLFILLFCGIFCLVGVIFGCIGLGMKLRRRKLEEICTQYTTANVVSVIETYSYDMDGHGGQMMFRPVIEYEANGGNVHTEFPYAEYPQRYFEGECIEIYYNPENPKQFYDVRPKKFFTLANVFLIVFGACVLIAVIGLVAGLLWM